MRDSISWLADGAAATVHEAIAEAAPALAELPLRLNDRIITGDYRFYQGSGVIDGAFVVKYAWSEPPARRIVQEAAVLRALRATNPDLPVPEVVVAAASPALLVTRMVAGEPLSWEAATTLTGRQRTHFVTDLAAFLAHLHDDRTLAAIQATTDLGEPEAQATTASLRARFERLIEPRQWPVVARWCDWVDHTLADSARPALLHGDLHGHNLVWDPATGRLRLVADFESAAAGDPAFDFRYLPGHAPTVELFLDLASAYEHTSGRRIDPARVMAWHILTTLGDALWRTKAGVALPGPGGTAASWVDDLQLRMRDILGPSAP